MNCAPDWRARVSSAVTRSPAGISICRAAGACAAAMAGTEQDKINSAPRSERIMVPSPLAGTHDVRLVPGGTNQCGKSPLLDCNRPGSAPGQHDRVASSVCPDRKTLHQQPDKGVGIGPAKIAAHAHGSDLRIADHDLAGVVTIDLGDRRGQRSVVKADEAAAPVQILPE